MEVALVSLSPSLFVCHNIFHQSLSGTQFWQGKDASALSVTSLKDRLVRKTFQHLKSKTFSVCVCVCVCVCLFSMCVQPVQYRVCLVCQ